MGQRQLLWPRGICDFVQLRTKSYHYIDRTQEMWHLANNGDQLFFLARPRRFGKSLLMSTLEAYFQGRQELFQGLKAEQLEAQKGEEAWCVSPVLRFDMSAGDDDINELRKYLSIRLRDYENQYKIQGNEFEGLFSSRLEHLIDKLAGKGKPPVLLIDEYDHPLAYTLPKEKKDAHEEFKNLLRSFYSVFKRALSNTRFVMLTGVSQFQKVSVFSGLNNVVDITLDPDYATICGITEQELREHFHPRVQEFATKRNKSTEQIYDLLRKNYDGYRFSSANISLYNPYSVIRSLQSLTFSKFWYHTGTPYVLHVLYPESWFDFTQLERNEPRMRAEHLLSFDSLLSNPIPLLFQAGYLTIKAYDEERELYRLGFPNTEVRDSFYEGNQALILGPRDPLWDQTAHQMLGQLQSGNVPAFMESLDILLAKVPYDSNLRGRPIPEVHFQVALFLIFRLTGREAQLEMPDRQGRSDLEVQTDGFIYIFEFKVNSSPQKALLQIRARDYALKHRDSSRQIILVGMNFNGKSRKFSWKAEYDNGKPIPSR